MKKSILILMILISVGLFTKTSHAGKDFASSLSGSLLSFPPAVSVAGAGGFWAALPSPYSQNPASFVTMHNEEVEAMIGYDVNGGAYTEYGHLNFKEGPNVNLWTANAITTLKKGVIRFDYYHLSSSRAKSKVLDLDCKLEGDSLQIGYGYPINEKLSLGVSIAPIYSSDVQFKSNNLLMTKGKSKAQWYRNFGLGLLYHPKKWLYLGLAYGHSKSELTTDTFNLFNYKKNTEYPVTNIIRPGIVIQPKLGTTLGVDWLWGQIDNEHGKKYYINQWFFGAEQYLTKNVAIRAGRADGGTTGGLGLRWKRCVVDYAYLNNSLKEMKRHFGKSSSHLVTFTYFW